jgi:hypothetical protein
LPDIGICNDPVQVANIAGLLASGQSQTQVAEILGVNRITINRAANKPDIKALIHKTHQQLINNHLTTCSNNISHVIQSYPIYEAARDKDFATLSLKYSAEVLRSVGILPTQAQSILIQNIYNQTNISLAPAVTGILGKLGITLDNEVQDAELVDPIEDEVI